MSGLIIDGYLYFVPVILVVAGLRGLPGFFRTERYAADEAFHIYLTDEIRQNGHRIPDAYEQLLPHTAVHYPALVHWLMSFVSKKRVVSLSPYFAVIVDSLHALVVMAMAAWLFSTYAPSVPTGPATVLTGLIFVLTPKLVTGRPLTARLRLGGRAPGVFFFTCSAGSYIGWVLTGHLLFFIIAVFGVGLVALTSSFSSQTLALFYIGFGIVFFDLLAFVVLTGGGVFAYLVSRGRYSGTFHAHTGTLLYYFRHIELERAARFKNRISKIYHIRGILENLPQVIRSSSTSRLKSALVDFCRYVYSHHIIGAYLQLPFLIFIPILLAFGTVRNVWLYLLIWVLVLLVANAAITIPGVPGNPAHRYTEYLVAPLSMLAAYTYFSVDIEVVFKLYDLAFVSGVLLLSLVIYCLGAIAANSALDVLVSPSDDLSHAVDFLATADRQSHVFAIPGPYGKRLLPDTDHVQMQAIHDHFSTSEGRREIYEFFFSPDGVERFEKLNERFGIDYILGDIDQIEEECGGDFDPLFKSGNVGVYTYKSVVIGASEIAES